MGEIRQCLWGDGECHHSAAVGSEYCAGHRAEVKARQEPAWMARSKPARPPRTKQEVAGPAIPAPRPRPAPQPVTDSVVGALTGEIGRREAQVAALTRELETLRQAVAVLER